MFSMKITRIFHRFYMANPHLDRYSTTTGRYLITLKERRERGDLIEAYKVMAGHNRVDKNDWFTFRKEDETIRSTRSTITAEGESRKENVLFMEHVRLEVRKNCFNVRVIKTWNALPEEVKKAKSLNAFKNAYDKWMKEQKLTNRR